MGRPAIAQAVVDADRTRSDDDGVEAVVAIRAGLVILVVLRPRGRPAVVRSTNLEEVYP